MHSVWNDVAHIMPCQGQKSNRESSWKRSELGRRGFRRGFAALLRAHREKRDSWSPGSYPDYSHSGGLEEPFILTWNLRGKYLRQQQQQQPQVNSCVMNPKLHCRGHSFNQFEHFLRWVDAFSIEKWKHYRLTLRVRKFLFMVLNTLTLTDHVFIWILG